MADRLPAAAYAHELNPVEPVWAHLKRSLANLTKHNLAELTALVKTRLKRRLGRRVLIPRLPLLAALGVKVDEARPEVHDPGPGDR